MSKLSLAGVFTPIPTPFRDDGQVDYDRLEYNLNRWNQEPLAGYVVCGSNGEYAYLTVDERVELIRGARQVIPSNGLLIAGSGMESTHQTIDLTRRMAGAGADVAIVVTPCYYRGQMTAAALERHYRQVADASPVPVVLYSVPANTGLDLPAQVAVSLAKHPNIIGMKDSGGDVARIGYMAHETRDEEFQILAGSAGFLLAALAVGAVGGVCALANIAAARLTSLWKYFLQGNAKKARELQLPLIEVNTAVTSRFGVPGLKAAMDLLGYYGGPVRAPLMVLPEEDKATLRNILQKAELL
ncbi:MAG TPA: dihydrodipicolinate synthase family protein [Syntrophobacteraceae bacterium]|nr:dihydrodipicolinate synthase family protein [Syntrophobacteraceae bacterium]